MSASLIAVGLSHLTAPVAVRERLALDADEVRRQLRMLTRQGIVREALLVSTCNRVELYAVAPDGGAGVRSWLDSFRGPENQSIAPYLYWHRGRDAVRHLFRVASALDSLVLGEPQILGQVKVAIQVAVESGSMGRILTRLSQRSLSVAKRVRTETSLGRSRVGVGNAGVDLAMQVFGALAGRRAMLIGTGEMGRQVAAALVNSGIDELIVASKTRERAVEVAGAFNGTPITMDRFGEYLPRVDVVVTATNADANFVVGVEAVQQAIRHRRYQPLLLIDLAVPRNVDPRVDDLEHAYLFNVDDLRLVVDAGKAARVVASEAAAAVVEQEADRFLASLGEVQVGPRIGAITAHMENVRRAELSRSKRLLGSLNNEQLADLEALTKALVKKALHAPLTSIRSAARTSDHERLEALLAPWEDSTNE